MLDGFLADLPAGRVGLYVLAAFSLWLLVRLRPLRALSKRLRNG